MKWNEAVEQSDALLKAIADHNALDADQARLPANIRMYKFACRDFITLTADHMLHHFEKLNDQQREQAEQIFRRAHGIATRDGALHEYLEYGMALMQALRSLDWGKDVRVTRTFVSNDAAFEEFSRKLSSKLGVGNSQEPSYPQLRRRIIQCFRELGNAGEVVSRMHIPATYESTTLYPATNAEAHAVSPLLPVQLRKEALREMETLVGMKYASKPQKVVERLAEIQEAEYVRVLKLAKDNGIYPELQKVDDIKKLPPLKQLTVIHVIEDFAEPDMHSPAQRNYAQAMPYFIDKPVVDELKNNKMNYVVASRMRPLAANDANRRPEEQGALFTYVKPHNPSLTQRMKAKHAYPAAMPHATGYHLGRSEDMERALLHEMAHAISFDKAEQYSQGASATEPRTQYNVKLDEMVCDTFVALSLGNANLRAELRALNAFMHSSEYDHYTNPALRAITKDDLARARSMDVMQRYQLAHKIALSAELTRTQIEEMNEVRWIFHDALRVRLGNQNPAINNLESQIMFTQPEVLLECLKQIQLRGSKASGGVYTEFQRRLIGDAIDDLRHVMRVQKRQPEESYLEDLTATAKFTGSILGLVEMLHTEIGQVMRSVDHIRDECAHRIMAGNDAAECAESMRSVGAVAADLRDLATFAHTSHHLIRSECRLSALSGANKNYVGRN